MAAVGTVNTATAPLKRKLEKDAGCAQDFIEKRAGYVYQMAQNKLNDAKLILEGDGEGTSKSLLAAANAEYKMQAGRKDEDGRFIPGALSNEVLGAENKVAAMDGEAHSAMNGWTTQIDQAAAEWSDDEGAEFSGLIPNAVTEVKEAATAMKSEFLDDGKGLVDA